jgi:stage III sporulation protein AA
MYHTLIISPPRCGKTTLLRDMIRQISDGNDYVKGCSVGVVDERSELAGSYQGIPQNQMGIRTDVLDGCPKAEGMLMLIRSMSPQVIAVDEIGAPDEVQAIKYAMHCGCKMIATVHGESLEEIRRKPLLEQMISEQCFERYVVLSNRRRVGKIANIYDKDGVMIFTESRNV